MTRKTGVQTKQNEETESRNDVGVVSCRMYSSRTIRLWAIGFETARSCNYLVHRGSNHHRKGVLEKTKGREPKQNIGARYYEPTSGRFLSADPMGHGTSPSLYDFCGGDPVNYFDPLGLGPLSLQQQLTQAQNISNQAALKIQQAGGSVPLSNGEVSSLAADATNTGTALYVAAHYSQPESTTGQLATTVYRSDVAANVAESAGDVLSVAGAAVTGYQIGKAINNGIRPVDDLLQRHCL